ncbi:MAG: DUF3667 domain-containing protein [Bernardetiaceae bacterium]
MVDYFSDILELKKGTLKTTSDLLLRPSTLIRDYLYGKTLPYQNPFKFLLSLIGVSLFVQLFIAKSPGESLYVQAFNLSLVVLLAGAAWLVFRKEKYNFFEHLIVSGFAVAKITLLALLNQIVYFLCLQIHLNIPYQKAIELGIVAYAVLRLNTGAYQESQWVLPKSVLIVLGSFLVNLLLTLVGDVVWKIWF